MTDTPITDTIYGLMDDGEINAAQANAALAAIWRNSPTLNDEWNNARRGSDLAFFATVDDDGHVAEWCEPCTRTYLALYPASKPAPINPRYERCCDQCGAYRDAQS
jgi:hypothetical protein